MVDGAKQRYIRHPGGNGMNRAKKLLSATILATLSTTYASAGPIATTEGISGDVDVHDRNPILSFGKDVFADSTRILVDAMVKNGDYSKYPIRFDFYVNGNLLLSQFRSQELPVPVGITLSKTEYPLPYNYTIVATLVTPNRTFSTTAYGSMTASDVSASLPCTVTINDVDYGADSVTAGAGTFSFNAEGDGGTKEISVTLTIDGAAATGTVTVTGGDSDGTPSAVTGTAVTSNGTLTALELTDGSSLSLSCGS